jgi:probable rRNA maturation factor
MEEELGDIYISLEKAEEQAKDFEVTFMDESLRLLIHGILHLLGYDHERSIEDEKIMQKLEEDILQKISG